MGTFRTKRPQQRRARRNGCFRRLWYRETSSSLVHLLNSPCKGVEDSIEFSIARCGFCGSFSVKLRFRIPKVRGQTEWIPDSSSCITASYALVDSGFNKQKFPGFRIPQAKFPRISLNEVILNANIFSQFWMISMAFQPIRNSEIFWMNKRTLPESLGFDVMDSPGSVVVTRSLTWSLLPFIDCCLFQHR